jgi:hypothetical protein
MTQFARISSSIALVSGIIPLLLACSGDKLEVAADAGLDPVSILRGDPNEPASAFSDLILRGEALESYDGKIVTVRIGIPDRPPERLGSAQTRIENGTFRLTFPLVWERDLYKKKIVFIDVNSDGVCNAGKDLVLADNRSVIPDGSTLIVNGAKSVNPAFVSGRDPALMSDSLNPAEDCAFMNMSWPTK